MVPEKNNFSVKEVVWEIWQEVKTLRAEIEAVKRWKYGVMAIAGFVGGVAGILARFL